VASTNIVGERKDQQQQRLIGELMTREGDTRAKDRSFS
jgi:hypothetical protein